MTRHALLFTLLMTSAAACGKSEQEKQAEDAAKKLEAGAQQVQQGAQQMAQAAQDNSKQMAQGLQQMAQGFQQMTQGAGKAVEFEELKALLPEVNGWARSEAKGEQMTMPVSYARAQARYDKDAAHIELEITDTALNQLLLAPISMFLAAGYSERSDEGFKRATKVGNQPGMEEWNVDSKRGEVTAVVANRFIVHATGHNVDAIDSVRATVQAVDFARLANLK